MKAHAVPLSITRMMQLIVYVCLRAAYVQWTNDMNGFGEHEKLNVANIRYTHFFFKLVQKIGSAHCACLVTVHVL